MTVLLAAPFKLIWIWMVAYHIHQYVRTGHREKNGLVNLLYVVLGALALVETYR